MPLRDHFHPPISDPDGWDGVYGAWPAMVVIDLNERLPPRYAASPRIHLGPSFEIDAAASEHDGPEPSTRAVGEPEGGTAPAMWAPPQPTLAVETDVPVQDEYEVRVYETEQRRLVAAVEIVSPANKARPGNRRMFVARCATLLQQGVSVSIVDLVTSRWFNLYANLLDLLGLSDPSLAPAPTPVYAVTCRWRQQGLSWRLETWFHALMIGRPLPTLPLWLTADRAVPLDLEPSYERTCRTQRIP